MLFQGTPIFMAVELRADAAFYDPSDYSYKTELIGPQETPSPASPKNCHNFQHDLESIFWILAWLVFTHIPGQNGADVTAVAAKLFHSKNLDFQITRWNLLVSRNFCDKQLKTLRPDLPSVLAKGLFAMRAILHTRYLDRKSSISSMPSYSPIYGEFCDVLRAIAASVPRGTVRLVRPAPPNVGVRSGYLPRTDNLRKKMEKPEDIVLAPHKASSMKRVRGASDAGKVDDESRPEKRPARG